MSSTGWRLYDAAGLSAKSAKSALTMLTLRDLPMAINYFQDYTEAELLAMRREVSEEIRSGGQLTNSADGEISASMEPQIAAQTRYSLIQQALTAIDPVTYPITSAFADRTTLARPMKPNI